MGISDLFIIADIGNVCKEKINISQIIVYSKRLRNRESREIK